MSLLMKALEKAAQDRDKMPDKQPAPVAHASAASSALSLEPIEPTLEPLAPPTSPKPADSTHRDAPRNIATPGASGTPTRGLRSTEQTRASVLLNAKPPTSGGGGAVTWISTHPVPFTAALAGLFALGYGTYIYLQAAHPGLFLRTPPPPSQLPVLAVVKPAPVPPAPVAQGTADTHLIPAQSVFNSSTDVPSPSPATTPATAPVGRVGETPTAKPATAPAQATSATASATPSITPAPQSKISVSRGDNAAPRVSPAVSEAYAALESGRFDTAQRLYEQALRGEPNNIDALLGLASIAQYENRTEDASRHFLKILDIDPRNSLAQTGLIALVGRADPQAAETRLKQLAARDPSPSLYFTLGNLYADQAQWSQAQQAYFQAHHLDAGNPDYAYNLAVALEHLGQQKLALGFYRRAVQMAAGRGRANFNPTQAQTRISQLAARLE